VLVKQEQASLLWGATAGGSQKGPPRSFSWGKLPCPQS